MFIFVKIIYVKYYSVFPDAHAVAMRMKQKIALWLFIIPALICLACFPVSAAGLAPWYSLTSGTPNDLNSVWGSASSSVFAVGNSGTILRFNGSVWSSMSSGTAGNLNAVWGAAPDDVFAVGQSGTILHYDGSKWGSLKSGTASDLNAVWGSAADDVFAVGKSGTILHYDGSKWSSLNSGITTALNAVWGTAGKVVFAVGSSGTILRYNGSAWNAMTSGITVDLNAVWGAGSTAVFAVGQSGTIVHYDGSGWSSMKSGAVGDLYGIWGAAGDDIFVVGESNIIVHYDGSKWGPMNRSTLNVLSTVWGFSASDVFAAGSSGAVLRYLPPVITSISLDQADKGTTLNITITGSNLSGASDLGFGTGISVDNFTVSSSDQITASVTIVAGASTGARDVSVTTPGGTFTLPKCFTVQQTQPTITSVNPDQDRQAARLNVTISGTNFSGASELRLGTGIAVDNFTVLNSNQIAAKISIAADAAAGTRDVSVITASGVCVLPNGFTVKQALPAITSISPNQDRQAATLNVSINGTNLIGTSELRLGPGIAVNTFTVLSSNQIAANITVAPDAAAGTRDITVTTPGGSFTLAKAFTTQQALPTLTSLNPDQGNQDARLNITIAGTNLTGASEVGFGTGIVVDSFSILSSSQMSAAISLLSGAAIGARDVSVTTPGGSFTLPNSFTVKQALPVISSISPGSGSQGATLNVTITGMNFNEASEVRLGTDIAVNSFSVLSSGQLTAGITIVAGADTGARDVSITTPGGSFTLPNGFTVKQAPPMISSISPNEGSQGAILTVNISGSNFDRTASVSFGSGVTVESFTNLSPTQLRVNIKIEKDSVTGLRDVSVTTAGGSSTLANSFTIKAGSIGTLILALIWVGIALVVVVFVVILNILRKKRAAKL